MTPERWQQVREILEPALERAKDDRVAYLDLACGDDDDLRREVESLIAASDEADDFIETPPLSMVAESLSDQPELQSGERLGHYKVISRLSRGGMGEVYLARDDRLGRKVALKLLPSIYTTDQQRVRRFEQEARAASALNHPNILMIFDIGRAEQKHFIASEFVEGRTIRDALAEGPLRPTDALDVAIQSTAALAAAHRAGIVHRDIKPENIMIRPDGYVKVLDFGLAKLAEKSVTDTTSGIEQLTTAPGLVMGTPGYMSPEQARGHEVDERSDIFSLGVVIYEMIAGCSPFKGETPTDAIASILKDEPPALSQFCEETPAELQRVVSRTLQKEKASRYQSAEDLLIDLQAIREEIRIQSHLDQSSDPQRAASIASGAGRAVSSAEYLVTGIRNHYRMVIAVVLLLIVSTAAIFYFNRPDSAIRSVAVLPLANMSGDPEADYLSDGIADSLITRLSQLLGLRVMSFNSVSRYKGQNVDSRQVGREMNVQVVLVGRMLQRGDDLSIIVELVDARDNHRIWGRQYNRKLSDMLAVQEEISKEITENLRLKLTGEDQKRLAKTYTENSEAYRLYLKGRYHWSLRSEEGFRRGIEFFNQAIEKDPAYALAWAGLADCYGLLSNYSSTPPAESMARARNAAMKALAIDETLAEAHTSLGLVKKEYDWDVAGAEREFQRAIELNPNYPTAHQWRAENLITLKRTDEALSEMKLAQELDPFSLIISSEVGWVFYHARRFDEAIDQLQKTAEMSPNFPRAHFFLGRVYEQKQMYDEAITETQKAISLSGGYALYKASLGHILGMAGRRAEAEKIVEELKERSKREYVPPFAMALVYTGLGEKDRAFEWLEKAYKQRDTILINYIRDPQLAPVRADQRFADMLDRLGLAL